MIQKIYCRPQRHHKRVNLKSHKSKLVPLKINRAQIESCCIYEEIQTYNLPIVLVNTFTINAKSEQFESIIYLSNCSAMDCPFVSSSESDGAIFGASDSAVSL